MKMMVDTWDSRSEFSYEGCILTGTKIWYGEKSSVKVTSQQYAKLRGNFLGQVIPAGASRTTPPTQSLGEWLKNNVTKTAIASYVAPILVREGYAVKEGKGNKALIRIIR